MGDTHKPFTQFGKVLKSLRSAQKKSTAEVSSAVEIDEQRLHAYENGEQRPSEDILLLLIRHFGLHGEQADSLWRLAGYSGQPDEDRYYMNAQDPSHLETVAIGLTIQDPRIIYTDMVQVMANNYGVILNFMQGAGQGSQPLAVARVGMSKEHARSIIALLQQTLDQAEYSQEPRRLEPPQDRSE